MPSWWRSNRFSASSRHRDLNKSTMNIPSECKTASIGPQAAGVLPICELLAPVFGSRPSRVESDAPNFFWTPARRIW